MGADLGKGRTRCRLGESLAEKGQSLEDPFRKRLGFGGLLVKRGRTGEPEGGGRTGAVDN